MKRKITFLIAALMLITMINQPGKAVGQTRSVSTTTFKNGDTPEDGGTLPYETGGLAWTTSIAPNGWESTSPNRGWQYSGGADPTISTTGINNVNITGIDIVASTNNNANTSSISVSVGSTSLGSQNMPKENDKTYTFSYQNGVTGDISISFSNASKSVYIKSITITYTCKITYNANNATSGSVPNASTHNAGANVTLATNTGNLVKTGYSFNGQYP